MSRLGEHLRRFHCGPHGHAFELTTFTEEVDSEELAELLICAGCHKHGSLGVCGFCEEAAVNYGSLSGPSVDGTVVVPLCSACHLDLVSQDDCCGWTFVEFAGAPVDDP